MQVPAYAVYNDHDYGVNNSDRTQPGKERSLRTFFEIWANPPTQTVEQPGIWTRFVAGQCEFWLLDGRYRWAGSLSLNTLLKKRRRLPASNVWVAC